MIMTIPEDKFRSVFNYTDYDRPINYIGCYLAKPGEPVTQQLLDGTVEFVNRATGLTPNMAASVDAISLANNNSELYGPVLAISTFTKDRFQLDIKIFVRSVSNIISKSRMISCLQDLGAYYVLGET